MNVKDQIIEQIYAIEKSGREPVQIEMSPNDYSSFIREATFSEISLSADRNEKFMGLSIVVKAAEHKLTVTSRDALRERE